ncbi:metallophosphoesterase, partial [Salmonella enterica]
MASEHVQTIDLTNFSGRVFFLADPHGHYSTLCNLIHSISEPDEELIVFSTGNLFDYGPEPMELMTAINTGIFDGRSVRVFSAAGAGEEMLKKLLPINK